jgi:hypothetical protein
LRAVCWGRRGPCGFVCSSKSIVEVCVVLRRPPKTPRRGACGGPQLWTARYSTVPQDERLHHQAVDVPPMASRCPFSCRPSRCGPSSRATWIFRDWQSSDRLRGHRDIPSVFWIHTRQARPQPKTPTVPSPYPLQDLSQVVDVPRPGIGERDGGLRRVEVDEAKVEGTEMMGEIEMMRAKRVIMIIIMMTMIMRKKAMSSAGPCVRKDFASPKKMLSNICPLRTLVVERLEMRNCSRLFAGAELVMALENEVTVAVFRVLVVLQKVVEMVLVAVGLVWSWS